MPKAVYPELRKLHVYLTRRCNQRCEHCWVEASPGQRERVVAGQVNRQIDKAIPLGLKTVKITGGEPLLFKRDVQAILEHASDLGLLTRLETNALLVREDFAAKLHALGTIVGTSLDGCCAESHDTFRNLKGGFDRTIKSVATLITRGVPVEVVSCIQRANFDEIDRIIDLCKTLGVISLKFNFPAPYGRAIEMERNSELLSTAEIIDAVRQVEESYQHGLEMELDFDIPRAFRKHPLLGLRCEVLNLISILPDGRYSLCGIGITHGELTFGTIEESDVDSVWKKNAILTHMRDTIPYSATGVCGKCTEYDSCYSHCIAYCLSQLDSLNGPHPLCQDAYEKGLFPEAKLVVT